MKEESLVFRLIRYKFFLLSIGFLAGGLGWNWHYHAAYKGGLKPGAKVEEEEYFNYHVVLMMFGFFLPNAIAAGAFRFFTFLKRDSAKWIHGILNTVGLVCSWAGFATVHKHQQAAYDLKFWQPHTWIGMFTMVVYTLNWIMGAVLYTNMKCVPGKLKAIGLPIHRALGSLCYVLIALSTFLGLFSNYVYDIKYDPDYNAGNNEWHWKVHEFNEMLLFLTIGTSLVFYYFTDNKFVRPRDQPTKSISPGPTESSKNINGDDLTGLRKIKPEELALHASKDDIWVVLNSKVYDLTKFDHPGGAHEIFPYGGKDISKAFKDAGHGKSELMEVESYLIGVLENPLEEKTV